MGTLREKNLSIGGRVDEVGFQFAEGVAYFGEDVQGLPIGIEEEVEADGIEDIPENSWQGYEADGCIVGQCDALRGQVGFEV